MDSALSRADIKVQEECFFSWLVSSASQPSMDLERADRMTTDPGRAERDALTTIQSHSSAYIETSRLEVESASRERFPGSLVESTVLVVGSVFSQHEADVHLEGGVRHP